MNVVLFGPETIAWPAIWYSTSRTSEPSSLAVTVTVTGPVCQPVGIVVLSIGASVSSDVRFGSTVVLNVFQSLQLPALSCTRVLSTCGPAPLIVAWGWVLTAPLSSVHSTEPDGPDNASVAVMEILRLLGTVAGTVVVSTGLTESMLMVSLRQPEKLPAMSLSRVESVCTPSPLT